MQQCLWFGQQLRWYETIEIASFPYWICFLMKNSFSFAFFLFFCSLNCLQEVASQQKTIGSRDLEIFSEDRLFECSILHNGDFAQGGTSVFVEPIKEDKMLNYIDVKLEKKVEGKKEIIVQLYSPKQRDLPNMITLDFSWFISCSRKTNQTICWILMESNKFQKFKHTIPQKWFFCDH